MCATWVRNDLALLAVCPFWREVLVGKWQVYGAYHSKRTKPYITGSTTKWGSGGKRPNRELLGS